MKKQLYNTYLKAIHKNATKITQTLVDDFLIFGHYADELAHMAKLDISKLFLSKNLMLPKEVHALVEHNQYDKFDPVISNFEVIMLNPIDKHCILKTEFKISIDRANEIVRSDIYATMMNKHKGIWHPDYEDFSDKTISFNEIKLLRHV